MDFILKENIFFQYLFFIVIAYLEANNFFVVVILAISVNIIVFFLLFIIIFFLSGLCVYVSVNLRFNLFNVFGECVEAFWYSIYLCKVQSYLYKLISTVLNTRNFIT